jgi:hypothetical protein
MQEVKIKATLDPKEAQVGFQKVEQASTSMASKVQRSAAAMRTSLNSVSGSAMGIAKVFITMEVAKRALRGLYEMAQLTETNKKNIDAMNAAMGGTAAVISEKMTPAVTAIAGLIKETADSWTAFLSGGNFGGTTDKQFEKLRDMQLEIMKLQEQTTKGNKMQQEGARIALAGKQKEYDAALTAHAEEMKFASEEKQRAEQAARDEEAATKADERRKQSAAERLIQIKQEQAARSEQIRQQITEEQNAFQASVDARNEAQQSDIGGITNEEWIAALDEATKAKNAEEEADLARFRRAQNLEAMKAKMKEDAYMAEVEYAKMNMQAGVNGLAAAQILFGKNKKLAIAEQGLSMGVAMMNALATKPFFPLGLSQFALAGAIGIDQMAKTAGIRAAAKGDDFVTNGPQLMLVGENSGGRERVQVTPLSSPNINGPKGGSGGLVINATIYNTGSAAKDEAYTDRSLRALSEQIRQAVRQGYNLGIN